MFVILSEILWIYLLNNNRLGLDIAVFMLFLLLGWLFMGIIGITLDICTIVFILVSIAVIAFIVYAIIHSKNRKKIEKERCHGE